MYHRKLSNKDWLIIEEKIQKKLNSWKGKLLTRVLWTLSSARCTSLGNQLGKESQLSYVI
jgi:hypothetical protein